MIHQLIIEPDDDFTALQKKARKLAMTGGYEVALSSKFNLITGSEFANKLLGVIESQYPKGSAAYKSSLAYRVIRLVEEGFDIKVIGQQKI